MNVLFFHTKQCLTVLFQHNWYWTTPADSKWSRPSFTSWSQSVNRIVRSHHLIKESVYLHISYIYTRYCHEFGDVLKMRVSEEQDCLQAQDSPSKELNVCDSYLVTSSLIFINIFFIDTVPKCFSFFPQTSGDSGWFISISPRESIW